MSDDGTSAAPSLAGRAVLAVVLLVGFYVLALSIAAVLVSLPYLEYRAVHRVHFQLLAFSAVGAFVILVALVPRRDRFVAPGPKLTADDQPELFRLIRSVAAKTGQAMPRDVYVVGDVNAWVAQRGGLMGIGSRRVMGIGLPLLQLLTVGQLRAVLAHEFGHFDGGDTKLGPWLYKTRAAIGRTLAGLARRSPLLMAPFVWYGNLFLRVTHAVSRQQELSADALACRVAGSAPLVQGLRTIHGAAPAFPAYWQEDVLPLLGAGFAPPIADGFRRFVATDRIAKAMHEHVERELREGASDPYDTHPPLRERIAAIRALPRSPAPATAGGDELAASLLHDVPGLERRMLELGRGATAPALHAVQWEMIGALILAPTWIKAVATQARAFGSMTPLDVFAVVTTGIDAFAQQLVDVPGGARERRGFAYWILASGLAHVLHRTGWRPVSLPGEGVRLTRDGESLEPFALVQRIAAGGMGAGEWSDLCARLDIAHTPIRDTIT